MTGIYDRFAQAFAKAVSELRVGNGLEEGITQVRMFARRQSGICENLSHMCTI